jgi:hypothetical protein
MKHTIALSLAAIMTIGIAAEVRAQTPPAATISEKSARVNAGTPAGSGNPAITMSAAGPSTLNSADQLTGGKNVSCVYVGVSHTGTPSNVLSIQGKVPGTSAYYNVLSTTAIATDTTATIAVGVSITTAANAGLDAVVPAIWRAQLVLGAGTAPTTTGYVACTSGE